MLFHEMLLKGLHILAANMDDLAALLAFAVVAVLFIAHMFVRRDVLETSGGIVIDFEFGDDAIIHQTF